MTSFPSAGRQCFRVAVILIPYLGDFLEAKLLSAPHPPTLLLCGPARLPVSWPFQAFCPRSPGLAAPSLAAVVRRWVR